MALANADWVKETSNTTGTGTWTLAGAVTGFRSFSIVGNGNTCYYSATEGTNWEVGIGTYSTTGPTLARTTILASSNSNAAVNFASTVTVGCSLPAGKAVMLDAAGKVGVYDGSQMTGLKATTQIASQATTSGTSKTFTGIPSTAKKIDITFAGVSTSGTSAWLVRIGNSTAETTGYSSWGVYGAVSAASTAGFIMDVNQGIAVVNGIMTLVSVTGNQWAEAHNGGDPTNTLGLNGGGSKTTSGTVDTITITTVGGTDTFDAGAIGIVCYS